MASPILLAMIAGTSLYAFQSVGTPEEPPEQLPEQPPIVGEALDPAAQSVLCEVRPTRRVFKVGESPGATVKIFNEGSEAVYLPGSLDDSERLKRYPHVHFELRDPAGNVVSTESFGCGFINPIREKDLLLVEPGHFFDPYEYIDDGAFFHAWKFESSKLASPGRYEVTFHYSTDHASIDEWKGSTDRLPTAVLDKLGRVPRVSIECSTTLLVEP